MSKQDSHRRFGLIGLALILLAFLAWLFVLPATNDTDLPDGLTDKPANTQTPPSLPTSEPPIPTPPTE